MSFRLIVVTFASAVLALPVFSQQAGIAGRWQCDLGVRETVVRENNLPSVYIQFEMMIYPNGTFQAQGIQNEQFPFQAEGQWVIDQNNAFIAQGQQQDYLGIKPYFFSSNIRAQNIMNSNDIGPTGKQVVSQCQRVG